MIDDVYTNRMPTRLAVMGFFGSFEIIKLIKNDCTYTKTQISITFVCLENSTESIKYLHSVLDLATTELLKCANRFLSGTVTF